VVQGAVQMLDRLHGRFPLCIATNATIAPKPMVEQALERGAMRHHFSDIFTFTELGLKKDTPEFWRIVATRMGVAIDEIAMLGDTLESDVLAPTRYGVQAVWFNPQSLAVSRGVTAVRWLEDFSALFLIETFLPKTAFGRGVSGASDRWCGRAVV